MTNTPDYAGRVEALEGPSREVDAEIATSVDGYVYEKRGRDKHAWFYPAQGWRASLHPLGSGALLPRYTGSIDAAIALCERVLPGWVTSHHTAAPNRWHFYVERHCADRDGVHPPHKFRGIGAPAISVCLATLRALEAQEDGG